MFFRSSSWLIGLLILCQGLAILLVQCTSPASSETEKKNKDINEVIDKVQKEFAPDKRTALFSVAVEEAGGKQIITGKTNMPETVQALSDSLAAAGLQIETAIETLPSSELRNNHFALGNLSVSNVRTKPKHSAELATQFLMGTPLKVWEKEGDWYLVQTPDQYLGWVDAGGIQLMTEGEWQKWRNTSRYIFIQDKGFLKAGPSKDAANISDLLAGNILEASGSPVDEYIQVKIPDGRIGFVEADAVTLFDSWKAQKLDVPNKFLQTAYSFLGRPYLWGGTSGNGVDCSGFTKSVFFQNGIILPRDASQQVHAGTEIKTDSTWQNLSPGDFLFFGKKAEGEQKEKITHVAIYLGLGRIIHSSGRVQVESLNPGDPDFAEERYNTFIRAKKMINFPFPPGVIPVRDTGLY